MKYFIRYFCLPILFSLIASIAFSQQILFRNYSVNDGLGSNTIWAISQDSEGYMWFGTKDGLNRFDGYNFKSFRYNKGNAKSLGSNFIHKILNFDKSHLWIATDLGVYILDMEKETFNPIKALANKAVFDLMKDSKGSIWISTRNHGLYQYKLSSEKLINYQNKNNDRTTISSNQIRRTIEDDDGNIWIAAFGGGVDVLDPVSKKLQHFKAGSEPGELSSNLILSLYKGLD
ncbi:two-component regulator propeller domain-containing protein, partial [Daejeonella sp.]|uniref:ligand-binding sensor domain-containing protein n=1 Tax=Daejeonella sp. TaxID=2805397 RepID=UPI0030BD7807